MAPTMHPGLSRVFPEVVFWKGLGRALSSHPARAVSAAFLDHLQTRLLAKPGALQTASAI